MYTYKAIAMGRYNSAGGVSGASGASGASGVSGTMQRNAPAVRQVAGYDNGQRSSAA